MADKKDLLETIEHNINDHAEVAKSNARNAARDAVREATAQAANVVPFPPNSPLGRMFETFQQSQEIIRHSQSEMEQAETLDRIFHANVGRMTTGLSPAAVFMSWADWAIQLSLSPNKQMLLAKSALEKTTALWQKQWQFLFTGQTACFDTEDTRFQERFTGEEWQQWPFCAMANAYLRMEDWWQESTNIRGMVRDHRELLSFLRYQWLNVFSPENYPHLNPQVIRRTQDTGGKNLVQGWQHFLEDVQRWLEGSRPAGTERYTIGKDIATTDGKVVYRNRLFELIQYSPRQKQVYKEPLLIIPAWIMKYYILDLSPKNSMVGHMVEQGHTVFMISWKNPDASYRNTGLEDYMKEGVLEALNAVEAITGSKKIHATGYCIGGTLLSMTAAWLARKGDNRLASLTLFAAQTDFEEAGELTTFIDENQLAYLEDIMFEQGYLRGDQMSATFDLLRPKELIWSKIVQEYLMGERGSIIDLIAWNEDTTRLPYRMHSEYLRRLYLENQLAEGDYIIDGEPLTLEDIQIPIFAVSTEKDHIAPWKSVYKLHHYTDAPITFILTNKGHNGGIVSEPGHKGRAFRIGERKKGERYLSPQRWVETHDQQEGSWWPVWHDWLAGHSEGKSDAPGFGNPKKGYRVLGDAPGTYVHEA